MHIIILSIIYQHLMFLRSSPHDYKEKTLPLAIQTSYFHASLISRYEVITVRYRGHNKGDVVKETEVPCASN